jgi:hypothetical protein
MDASLSLLASRDLGICGLELAENRIFSAVGLEAGDARQPHSSRNGDSSSTERRTAQEHCYNRRSNR